MTEKTRHAGQFKPGQSGNPAGKAKGTRHKATLAIEALMEGDAEAITKKAIEMAKGGDAAAIRMCLDRLAPPRKDAAVCFSLPPIRTIADAVEASSSLLAAIADGDVTPDEGSRIMSLLTSHKVLVETGEFERRLEALESKK
ncbi:MAG: hypothetical protein IPH79_09150 [Sphingomonadales bacterium]|nr:hypothetical protein [Sphingomonadales bacterium]